MNSRMRHQTQAAPPLNPARPSEGQPQRARQVRSLAPRVRRDFWLERVPETAGRYQLRGVTGVIFMMFGLMKAFHFTLPILVGAPGLHVATGAEGFARLLAALGSPFPLLNAWMVILMEVACGLGLILGAWTPATRLITRLCALPMAVDMMGALSVGVRQVRGMPVVLDGFPIMDQFWRLPLEVSLLLGMVFLLWRPAARQETLRAVSIPMHE
ncbi:DoxX family protein [Vitiosangium sp. GDMCC 1.1324]|uniref:DoxX family protein n=1 Tax=Vitiosangium sp. (strain GDMCC 1.1324) TaxID=2138576 RepID=UPI00130EF1B2|nr:DoxX family protein [Vitiosangium sp. GDMCC 1.1324]